MRPRELAAREQRNLVRPGSPEACSRLALGGGGRPAHVVISEALCDSPHAQEAGRGGL